MDSYVATRALLKSDGTVWQVGSEVRDQGERIVFNYRVKREK